MNICDVSPKPKQGDPLQDSWASDTWKAADTLTLDYHMGDIPEHRPDVAVKLLYDENFLYVRFRVRDAFVLATAENHQDPVCIDSCVEFFFTPSEDLTTGYFNIETNCGGTVLFHHQQERSVDENPMPVGLVEDMKVIATLPKNVFPEQSEPVTWEAAYRIRYESLLRYSQVATPEAGVLWRGNFYKCADRSSHPHWLTWAPVDRPTPDFHQKAFFGTIRFV